MEGFISILIIFLRGNLFLPVTFVQGTICPVYGKSSSKTEYSFPFQTKNFSSEEDYKNGNKNLKACDCKVDYVITHTCPLNLIPSLGGYHSAMEERQLQNYLQYVSETVYDSLTRWYFGHWHRDQEFGEKFRVVYLDLVDMETGKKIW